MIRIIAIFTLLLPLVSAAQTYTSATKMLSVPMVSVDGVAYYDVQAQLNAFTLLSVTAAPSLVPLGLTLSYNTTTNVLTVPAVSADGVAYVDVVATLHAKEVLHVGSATSAMPACTERPTASGRASGTNELMPGASRVRLATSTDGSTFNRTGQTVLDQVATPSLVLSPTGMVLMYYTAHKVDGVKDGAALSIGSADASQWKHCQLNFSGFPGGISTVDPDVVRRSDGTYRLYVTASVTGTSSLTGIHYADSADGINWTYGGLAFQHSSSVLDSVTFAVNGIWHMFTLSSTGSGMVHGTSVDGSSFTFVDHAERLMAGQSFIISQAVSLSGVTRLFAFGPRGQTIRSFTTTDGSTLVAGTVDHLTFPAGQPLESIFIKDPAVIRLASGQVLMAYSTAIP